MAALTDELLDSLLPGPRGAAALKSLRGETLSIGEPRPLDHQDFLDLAQGSGYSAAPLLVRIRASHHELARLLAAGYSRADCSVLTSYSQSRINVLCCDPTFKELIETYRRKAAEVEPDIVSQLKSVALDALGEFADRLETSPNDVTNSELLAAAKLGLDRAGFAPVQRSVNLNANANLTAEQLTELAAKASAQSRAEVVIKQSRSVIDAPAPPPALDAAGFSPADDPSLDEPHAGATSRLALSTARDPKTPQADAGSDGTS